MSPEPPPDRSGMSYVCPETVGYTDDLDSLSICGRRFVFRSSYRQHWLNDHYLPGLQTKMRDGIDRAQAILDSANQCTCPAPHIAWPKDSDAPARFVERRDALQRYMDDNPNWRQEYEGNWTESQVNSALAAKLTTAEDDATRAVWTEVDRKEATARLDAYLERSTVVRATGPIRLTRLDAHGQPVGEPFTLDAEYVEMIRPTPREDT